MTDQLRHYRKFLRNHGYPVPADDRDVVHTVRAIMKVRFPCGWSDHYKRQGGVVLSGVEQNINDGE